MSVMTLRVKRSDGSWIRYASEINASIKRSGFMLSNYGTYRSERDGVFFAGTLDHCGSMEDAAASLDYLMRELGEECVGAIRPHIWDAIEGPTINVGCPRN